MRGKLAISTMRMTARTLAVLLALGGGLGGCAPQQAAQPQINVTFNNKTFTSLDAFRAAYMADFTSQLDGVAPMSDRIGGKALVVLPDTDRLRPIAMAADHATANNVDAFVAYRQMAAQNVANALLRANLFDSVQVVVQNDTENPTGYGYDYVVWLKATTTGPNHTGLWISRWVMKRGNASTEEPLAFDPGVADHDRMMTFMRSIRSVAAELGGPALIGNAAAGSGTPRGSLTGFAVNGAGDVVTSEHGVNSCSSMRVHVQGQAIPATVVARDHLNDLALLHIGHSFAAPVTFRDGTGIRQAETVLAVGFPYGEKWDSGATVTNGSVSSLVGAGDDIRFLQFTAPVQPGNSGGPLLDPSGHVVGIVARKLSQSPAGPTSGDIPQNVNAAVKSAVIREFLDTNGVKYRAAPSTGELHSADIAAQAKQAVVYVECMR